MFINGLRTSFVIEWLRRCASTEEGTVSISGQEMKIPHMPSSVAKKERINGLNWDLSLCKKDQDGMRNYVHSRFRLSGNSALSQSRHVT